MLIAGTGVCYKMSRLGKHHKSTNRYKTVAVRYDDNPILIAPLYNARAVRMYMHTRGGDRTHTPLSTEHWQTCVRPTISAIDPSNLTRCSGRRRVNPVM
jgi:hypothetical protein